MSNSAIADLKFNYGRNMLGPVMAHYLDRLHTYLGVCEKVHGKKVLFAARAGVRIHQLLDLYQSRAGKDPLQHASLFWVSRLMAAKGIWNKARQDSLRLLKSQFQWRTENKFAEAMLRQVKGATLAGMRESKERGKFDPEAFFQHRHPDVDLVKQHFDEQAHLFEQYLNGLVDGYDGCVLVDTGWQGTTQRLLARAFKDIEWDGIYFGKSGFKDSDRTFWDRMIGVVFEGDQFDPTKPETCVVLHRHMIESLFEPDGPSIETFVSVDDTPKAVGSDILDQPLDLEGADPIFAGLADYVSNVAATKSPGEIAYDAEVQWPEIARFVVHPEEQDTLIYSTTERSADFGQTIKVPVLYPARNRSQKDDAQRRIREALWQGGQAAIEYSPEIAIPIQRNLAGINRKTFTREKQLVFRPHKAKLLDELPAVAVITRTLDRPTFLRRALRSVSAQNFKDYVHVIVNDGGDPGPAIEAIQTEDIDQSKVIFVDTVENRGMEAASNIAIAASRSKYIVIHDDDDTWEPAFLSETVQFLEEDKAAHYGGVITSTTYVSESFNEKGFTIHNKTPYNAWIEKVDIMEMSVQNFFAPICFLFKRAVYDKLQGYNEKYPVLGDWDFNIRFLNENNIGVLPKYLANYHHRDVGDTTTFGNSVIAQRDKHLEYSAIVRNEFSRSSGYFKGPNAGLISAGLYHAELRGLARTTERYAHEVKTVLKGQQGVQGHTKSPLMRSHEESGRSGPITVPSEVDRLWLSLVLARSKGRWPWSRSDMPRLALSSDGLVDVQTFEALTTEDLPPNLPIPSNFSEADYLEANPDVAEAVKKGDVPSGYAHYITQGKREGRSRTSLSS